MKYLNWVQPALFMIVTTRNLHVFSNPWSLTALIVLSFSLHFRSKQFMKCWHNLEKRSLRWYHPMTWIRKSKNIIKRGTCESLLQGGSHVSESASHVYCERVRMRLFDIILTLKEITSLHQTRTQLHDKVRISSQVCSENSWRNRWSNCWCSYSLP